MKFGEDINIEDAQLHMIQEMAKEFKNAHNKKWVDREEIENRIISNTPVQLKYCKSIKTEWLKKFDKDQAGIVVEKDYWEADGIKYYVDGHNVVQDHNLERKKLLI